MIIKPLDPFDSSEKYAIAGRKAEEKMAFYLKVDFEDEPDIHIINGLRVELDDGAVQIDHLVIHPYGMIIVESKSVTGKVQIKEDGQWIRWFNDQSNGMESPLKQGEIQAKRLKKHLNKAANPAGYFDAVPVDVITAISDQGVIIWPNGQPLKGVMKADQVTEKIRKKIDIFKSHGESKKLPDTHIKVICKYMLAVNKPLEKPPAAAPKVAEQPLAAYTAQAKKSAVVAAPQAVDPAPGKATRSGKICRFCGGFNLEIKYGHNYYFHCRDCNKSTPINSICPKCNNLEKLRKQGREFFVECRPCGTSLLFYTNP
jgi:hypothetical protein